MWEERIAVAQKEGMQGLVESTVRRWFAPASFASNAPSIEKARRMVAATPAGGYIACGRALQAWDYRQSLPQIKVPTLLAVGEADGITPGVMREMHQAMPGSQFLEIPDAGHLPCLEKTEIFNQALSKFLF